MSARACQLCGKPLSRIRVGTEGDFCSREHRNQYRLRQGMDRLMEANKVANLMRRREMPKVIVPQEVESSAPLSHRTFADPLPMPWRQNLLLKETVIANSGGKGPRLGQSRRVQIALVRFHVLGTADKRHQSKVRIRPSLALFLLPKARRGGMRAADRPPAPSRKLKVGGRRGDMLRVSRNSGFRVHRVEIRHTKPRLKTSAPRPGTRLSRGNALNRATEYRMSVEQWSGLRSRLYVAQPEFSYYKPWSGERLELRVVPGSTTAAGAVPPGPVAARVAQVRIELQESIRYAISSEEDRA